MWRRFKGVCARKGLEASKPNYKSVSLFVCHYVKKNKGSTRSIDAVVSFLRVYCRMSKIQWLDESDKAKLSALCRELKRCDHSKSLRKKAIRLWHLKAMLEMWDVSCEHDHLVALLFTMAFQGLLRSGELLGDLRVENIEWLDDNEFVLHLERTKTVREGEGVFITFRRLHGLGQFAGDLLRSWMKRKGILSQSKALLFPSRMRASDGSERTVSLSWFRKEVKVAMRMIGENPDNFSGHSFRAGGATELFNRRVPYPTIKKYGRWKSDSALDYYRDEEEIAKAVAKAFSRTLRRMER